MARPPLFARLKDFLFRSLALNDPKAWSPSLWNLYGAQSLSGEIVTEESALTYSAVWNAISLISGTIGALPLHLMQRKGDAKRIADDRRMYSVMHDQWNPWITAMAGRECLMAHVLTWGNGYAEKVFNGYGEVIELWPITPNRVRPERINGNLVYRIKLDREPDVILPRERILHIPGLGFDGFMGYSVIAMARKSIGLGMALETFGALYFGQGTHPGVVVSHPGQLSEQGNKNLKNSLVEKYSGLGQSHKLLLLEEGMKLEKLGIPPNDSQFLECVVPDTLLTMADGSRRPAKDIKKGDLVVGWKNNKTISSVVAATGNPKIKNLIRIKTARGRELTASEDHPCLAIEKLRTAGGRVPKENPQKWTPLKDLKIGSYVKIAFEIPILQENIMSSFEGYFLGAMAGDGYIRKASCSFTSADIGVIDHMKMVVKSLGGELKPRGGKLNKYNHDIITNGKSGRKGSHIRSLLNNSGLVGKHSNTKTVPPCIVMGGPDAWKGFLSGYFDADGSIREKNGKQTPAMYWSSVSLPMLQESQHLFSMLGIQSAIYSMSPGGPKKVMGKICESLPSWGLYIMGTSQLKKAAETLYPHHTEKAERLDAFLQEDPSRYREENFLYDRVVSIEEIGEGETIGIEIQGCHTHITNGIITHNSRQFQIPEVARWFNLPPHKLKDLTRSSFSNIESEQISFVRDSILPWLVRLEQNYSMQLLTPSDKDLSGRGRYYWKHSVEGLLRGDSASRAAFYGPMLDRGVFSINEVRALEDLDPVEGGDIHLVPLNMTTLENAGKPHEPPSTKVMIDPKLLEKGNGEDKGKSKGNGKDQGAQDGQANP